MMGGIGAIAGATAASGASVGGLVGGATGAVAVATTGVPTGGALRDVGGAAHEGIIHHRCRLYSPAQVRGVCINTYNVQTSIVPLIN